MAQFRTDKQLILKGVTSYDFEQTKQIGMDELPTYTNDTRLDNTYGANIELTGKRQQNKL